LKVPWTNLGEEAVVVEIDRVFLLASRVTLAEAERNAADAGLSTLERTRREVDERTKKLEEAELDWLRTSMGKMTKQMQEEAERKDSWMWKTFHTVLGNLQVKVTNVHFRYEDTLTTPNNPFACGLTIEKMSAVTVDDSGQPTFTTGGALEGIHKHMALENFSWYLDSSERFSAWKTHADWEPPSVDDEPQWWSLFGDGLSTEMSAKTRQYMCHPVTVELLYHRKGEEGRDRGGRAAAIL
jgi:Vacuolar protein sorting-associated protein